MEVSSFEESVPAWRRIAIHESHRCGLPSAVADDLAQDVLLRMWQLREELSRYRSLESFVRVVARHLIADYYRRSHEVAVDEVRERIADDDPHAALEQREMADWLQDRLSRLPDTQRVVMQLRQVERRSHAEIARLVGIQEQSVSTLLARARRTLLEELRERNKL